MKQAKSKKRRIFDSAMNVKTVKDKLEKKANVYLEKIADTHWERHSGKYKASGKKMLESLISGSGKIEPKKPIGTKSKVALGVVGGAALGAGAMALKHKLEKKAAEKWIDKAIKKPGALHKELGIPEDKKIPKATLDAAAKEGGKLGERARLAETLEGMHKKAEVKSMENKYLSKVAGAKDLVAAAKKAKNIETLIPKRKAVSAAVATGAGGYLAGRLASKAEAKHEKKAGLVSTVLGAAKNFAKGAVVDAPKLGDQLRNVKSAYNANRGLFNKGTMSTIKAVAGNKAVQAGAGLVGAGVVAGRMSKQAEENKYLSKMAGLPSNLVPVKQVAAGLVNKVGKLAGKPGANARIKNYDKSSKLRFSNKNPDSRVSAVTNRIIGGGVQKDVNPKVVEKIKNLDL